MTSSLGSCLSSASHNLPLSPPLMDLNLIWLSQWGVVSSLHVTPASDHGPLGTSVGMPRGTFSATAQRRTVTWTATPAPRLRPPTARMAPSSHPRSKWPRPPELSLPRPPIVLSSPLHSGDHSVKLTDVHTGKQIKVLEGHRRTPWVVSPRSLGGGATIPFLVSARRSSRPSGRSGSTPRTATCWQVAVWTTRSGSGTVERGLASRTTISSGRSRRWHGSRVPTPWRWPPGAGSSSGRSAQSGTR